MIAAKLREARGGGRGEEGGDKREVVAKDPAEVVLVGKKFRPASGGKRRMNRPDK